VVDLHHFDIHTEPRHVAGEVVGELVLLEGRTRDAQRSLLDRQDLFVADVAHSSAPVDIRNHSAILSWLLRGHRRSYDYSVQARGADDVRYSNTMT
jgi:hypothetical protein